MITNVPNVSDALLIERYESVVRGYVDEVLGEKITTGDLEKAACQRYLDDLKDDGHRFRLNKLKAAKALRFFPKLRHTQGKYKGKRFELYPIQAFMVWNIFGWERLNEPFRRFNEAYVTLARGNGKTPFGSALSLKVTGFDTPPMNRAETYLAATKMDQADIAYTDIREYIVSSGLSGRFDANDRLIRAPRGSTIRKLPADSKTNDGFRCYFVLVDEFHAWTESHRGFYDVIETGLGKFDQTLMVIITTAGDDQSLLWREKDNLATKIVERDNSIRLDEMFVMICRLDEGDDVLDIDNYPKSNPLMRYGVARRDKIEKMIKQAEIIPSIKSKLTRYYANQMVESGNKAITAAMWSRAVCEVAA